MANVKALVVGGGGAGGGQMGGGGGAGGYQYNASFAVTAQTYQIIVGSGGTGSYQDHGGNGVDSSFSTITATGGGGGAGNTTGGGSGGSGGGAIAGFSVGTGSQGNDGGTGSTGSGGSNSGIGYNGGGGGGNGSVGANATTSKGGNGGSGTSNSISGSAVTYCCGGGGGIDDYRVPLGAKSTGGSPNGGDGGNYNTNPGVGVANTGSGGGGADWSYNKTGGGGGSGIVIVSWVTSALGTCSVTGAGNAITTNGSDSIATFITSGNLTLKDPPLTINVYDSLNISENIAKNFAHMLSVYDTLNISEQVTLTPISISVNRYDTLNISENLTDLEFNLISVYDTLNISENLTDLEFNLISVYDTLNISEQVTLTPISISVNRYDTLNISENLTDLEFNLISVYQSLNISEQVTLSPLSISISIYDTLNISQYVSLANRSVNVYDSINISEFYKVDLTLDINLGYVTPLIDSFRLDLTNSGTSYANYAFGETFVVSQTATVTKTSRYLYRNGSRTGNLTARIYTISGVYGVSAIPNTLLAVSDSISANTINWSFPGPYTEFTFSGVNKISLSPGNYYMTIESSTSDYGFTTMTPNDMSGSVGDSAYYSGGVWNRDTPGFAFGVWAKLYTGESINISENAFGPTEIYNVHTSDLINLIDDPTVGTDPRYWVGGAGNWSDDTNHWATSSGGTPGTGNLPTQYNDVVFDINSGVDGATIYLDSLATPNLNNFTSITGQNYYINNSGGWALYVYGSFVSEAGLVLSVDVSFCSSSPGNTITMNGGQLYAIDFGQGGSSFELKLLDDLSLYSFGDIFGYDGTLDLNDHNINSGDGFFVGTPTVKLRSGTWTSNTFAISSPTVNLIPGTSTLKLSKDPTFIGLMDVDGYTFNNVWFTGGNYGEMKGTNHFNDFKIDTIAGECYFETGKTTYVNTFTAVGTPTTQILLQSFDEINPFYLSKSSGTVVCDYLTIANSHAIGGATWIAGDHSIDAGGNSGWIFTILYASVSDSINISEYINEFFPLYVITLSDTLIMSESFIPVDTCLVGYTSIDLLTGLKAQYRMNDSSSTSLISDSSVNGYNGVWSNPVTYPYSTPGRVDKSLFFEGNTSYVSIPNYGGFDGSTFSITTWVSSADDPLAQNRILSNKTNPSDTNGFEIALSGLTANGLYISGINSGECIGTNWSNTGWQHIAVIFSGISATVYINGAVTGIVFTNGVNAGTNPLLIGKLASASGYLLWKGWLDETRIYTKALSINEVQAIYNSGAGTEGYISCKEVPKTLSVFDSIQTTEYVSATYPFLKDIVVGDDIIYSDFSNTGEPTYAVLKIENMQITESFSLRNPILGGINLYDTLNISEIKYIFPQPAFQVWDYINISENLAITNSILKGISIFDSINISDIPIVGQPYTPVNVNDSMNISESIHVTMDNGDILIGDDIYTVEVISIYQIHSISTVDSISINEISFINIGSQDINLYSLIVIIESVAIKIVDENISIIENITIQDIYVGKIGNLNSYSSDIVNILENVSTVDPLTSIQISDKVIDKNLTDNASQQLVNGAAKYIGQSFTNSNTSILDKVTFKFYGNVGTPPGNVTAVIFAHTGVYGTSSQPTGSVLATSDPVLASSVSGQTQVFTFSGANRITLTAGTYYCISTNYNVGDGSNYLLQAYTFRTGSHSGNKFYSTNGSSWAVNSTSDVYFSVNDYKGEIVNLAESFSLNLLFGTITIYDTVTISDDNTTRLGLGNLSLVENINVSDVSLVLKGQTTAIFELLNISESVTIQMLNMGDINVFDTLNISVGLGMQGPGYYLVIAENILISENYTVSLSLGDINVTENISISEGLWLEKLNNINIIEILDMSESIIMESFRFSASPANSQPQGRIRKLTSVAKEGLGSYKGPVGKVGYDS